MTTAPAAPPPAPSGTTSPWHWPLDPARYDRAPDLTAAERAALTRLDWDVRRWPKRDQAQPPWTALERLIRPLADARASLILPATCEYRRTADDAVAVVLHGCAALGTAFWAWDADDWLRILCADQRAFRRHYPGWVDASVRPSIVAVAYLLDCFAAFHRLGAFNRLALAGRVFGTARVDAAVERVLAVLRGWGYHSAASKERPRQVLCEALLRVRSPDLAALTARALAALRADPTLAPAQRSTLHGIQRALAALGLVAPPPRATGGVPPAIEGVDPAWADWVERWHATSTLTPDVRGGNRTILFKVGRWLATAYPAIREPAGWTRETCAAYLAAVERLCVGDYAQRREALGDRIGQPLSPRTKASYIVAARTFFRDAQEWGWIPRRFDPARALATPRGILALVGPDPRVIADASWAKLLWAGLNLAADDLPANVGGQFYPLALVRALALVWLFGGLRSDEIVRLRVGCIRWQRDDVAVPGHPGDHLAQDAVCLLDVPSHKTGTAFTKPVDPLLGRAVAAWEAVRPAQPPLLDRHTGERVAALFCYRARRVAKEYLNHALIPALCAKAGVPVADVRGRITSHRARATIASQLYNAKEPMTLFELQAWLGHRSPETTQHYARITPTTLAKAYSDAGYFARNVRTIEVLLDREAVATGAAAGGAPWQYYDLGPGYCTYSFFEHCPHRLACARCDFYLPKGTTRAQLLEGRANLQRMLQAIPLSEEEQAAVEDGLAAHERLLARLADVPTPAGPTPRELACASEAGGCPAAQPAPLIPLAHLRRTSHEATADD